jgi:hypothetical protein
MDSGILMIQDSILVCSPDPRILHTAGMLEAALSWYKTFRQDLKDIGFVFNPYNPCVANKKVQGSQQTIVFHVDNLKSSHKLKL